MFGGQNREDSATLYSIAANDDVIISDDEVDKSDGDETFLTLDDIDELLKSPST